MYLTVSSQGLDQLRECKSLSRLALKQVYRLIPSFREGFLFGKVETQTAAGSVKTVGRIFLLTSALPSSFWILIPCLCGFWKVRLSKSVAYDRDH